MENGESDLAGKKRVREISEEEEEDMDFDAIQQQTGQANIWLKVPTNEINESKWQSDRRMRQVKLTDIHHFIY